ncbi:hypothetical protein CSB11_01795 [Candidatus Campbellbacteria bacterium]|nr:MAG: hypothetical protein CSB11_01795 [Candidatus Campbellbacteria bacterium]
MEGIVDVMKVIDPVQRLYITGTVTQEVTEAFLDTINKMEADYGSPDLILEIDSMGGNWEDCKSICCTIEKYKGRIFGLGTLNCSSAAFFILQKCFYRSAYENSKIVVHEIALSGIPENRLTASVLQNLSSGKRNGLHKKVDEIIASLQKDNKRIAKFLSERSGLSTQAVRNMMRSEHSVDPKNLLEKGFLDEIVYAF